MTDFTMAQLWQSAQEAGVSTGLLPVGPATVTIHRTSVNPKPASGDKPASADFGFFVKIVDGPNAGVAGWWNQNLGPGNPTGNGIFFRICETLGLDATWIRDASTTLEQIGAALIGKTFSCDIENRSGRDQIPRWNDCRNIRLAEALPGALPGQAPVAPAVAPVAAPAAPVAPVAPAAPVAAPAAPAQPVAPVAPVQAQPVAAPAAPVQDPYPLATQPPAVAQPVAAPAAPAVADVPVAPAAPAQPAAPQAEVPVDPQTGLPVPPAGAAW